jgi:glycosyltransferase involved in cell wall biosynthesis
MKLITVFTPTYNRAYCLGQVYNSLINQTSQDFKWLIIDDGSIDNTKELVQSWIDEAKIEIQYIYQVNKGMHGAHNSAYEAIVTPWNMCIDSDDWVAEGALEKISNLITSRSWDGLAGIVALDADAQGNIIGTKMPNDLDKVTLNGLYKNYGVTGDKKLIYRTDIVSKFPSYPIFKGERLVPLGTKYLQIDQEYNLLTMNEIICIVEYQEDGSSNTIVRQYQKSPRGFAYHRLLRIQFEKSFKDRFKHSMHLVSCCFFSRDFGVMLRSNKTILVLLTIPFGIILHLYIRYQIVKQR